MKNILFISHDATRTGAPISFLHFLKWFKKNSALNFSIILKNSGVLEREFSEVSATTIWNKPLTIIDRVKNKVYKNKLNQEQKSILKKLNTKVYDLLYFNSVASCELIIIFKKHTNIPVILHVHELEIAIKQFCGEDLFLQVIPLINHFIAASNAVKKVLIECYQIDESKISVVYENIPVSLIEKHRVKTSMNQDTIDNSFLVLAAGTTDWRKGADLLVQIGKISISEIPNIKFIWVGGTHNSIEIEKINYDIKKLGLQKNISFIGSRDNINDFLHKAQIFILPSREDPFPLVCLEAAAAGLPIICFENAGGMPEFVGINNAGIVVPYLDLFAMSKAITKLYNDVSLKNTLGKNALDNVKNYDTELIATQIKRIINDFTS